LRWSDDVGTLYVKLRPGATAETLKAIEGIWRRMEPAFPFRFSFLDAAFDQYYRTEMRLGRIFIGLTVIAVVVACLGLLGLASFAAEQRTKEIGVRKVLGASTAGITALLSRQFMKWVVLANVVAWPAAYWAMTKWLQAFAYRISLGPWIFLASGLAALALAFLTIGARTVRAAAANPVRALRYE